MVAGRVSAQHSNRATLDLAGMGPGNVIVGSSGCHKHAARTFMDGHVAGVTSSKCDCQMTAGCVADARLACAYMSVLVMLFFPLGIGAVARFATFWALSGVRMFQSESSGSIKAKGNLTFE